MRGRGREGGRGGMERGGRREGEGGMRGRGREGGGKRGRDKIKRGHTTYTTKQILSQNELKSSKP